MYAQEMDTVRKLVIFTETKTVLCFDAKTTSIFAFLLVAGKEARFRHVNLDPIEWFKCSGIARIVSVDSDCIQPEPGRIQSALIKVPIN